MTQFKIFAVFVSLLCVTACSGGSSSAKGQAGGISANNATELRGVWLEKKDAEELRSTGKLLSMCDEIKNHGGIVTNAINVQDSGRVTFYAEDPNQRDLVLLGNLDFSSKILTLHGEFVQSFGTETLQAVIVNDVLSFSRPQDNLFIFVHSNDNEINAYYQAQRACLK